MDDLLPPIYESLDLPEGRFIKPDILVDILHKAKESTPKHLVVFDLDSTLLDNRYRVARIVKEFGQAHLVSSLINCHPRQCRSWSLYDTMVRCGLDPELATQLKPELEIFWGARFFTSEYCQEDRALPGAAEYVNNIATTPVTVVYYTGRPENMREGTLVSFQREKFPLPDQSKIHLLMKPDVQMTDDAWKEVVHASLDKLGQTVAIFDNEPLHINTYGKFFPRAQCVHVLTDDSGRDIRVNKEIPSIKDFCLP